MQPVVSGNEREPAAQVHSHPSDHGRAKIGAQIAIFHMNFCWTFALVKREDVVMLMTYESTNQSTKADLAHEANPEMWAMILS